MRDSLQDYPEEADRFGAPQFTPRGDVLAAQGGAPFRLRQQSWGERK
jgi:hypothetical protein